MLQNDTLENMRHPGALVDATLHVVVDVLPLDDLDRRDLFPKERCDGLVVGDVPLVLELFDPDAMLDDPLLQQVIPGHAEELVFDRRTSRINN